TLHRYIHHILSLLVGTFYSKYVHFPEDKTPEEIRTNPKLYPYFHKCHVAVDGSHFHAHVSTEEMPWYCN
ncbi:hypothetical protein L218DRAFT_863017, partial [Marasmius fiardii PR-910]